MFLLYMIFKNKIFILLFLKVFSKKGRIDIEDGIINFYLGVLKWFFIYICEVGYYLYFV